MLKIAYSCLFCAKTIISHYVLPFKCVKQGTEKQKNSSMIILAKEGFLLHFILQQKDCKNTYFYFASQSIVHFCNAPVIFRMQGQTDHDVLNEQQQ